MMYWYRTKQEIEWSEKMKQDEDKKKYTNAFGWKGQFAEKKMYSDRC